MPERDWLIRIDHMVEFIDRISAYIEDTSQPEFSSHGLHYDAICRNLELIGEASTHVPDEVKARYPDMPWAEMRGLRNILAHGYMSADDTILWQTSTKSLGALRSALIALRAREKDEGGDL